MQPAAVGDPSLGQSQTIWMPIKNTREWLTRSSTSQTRPYNKTRIDESIVRKVAQQ